MLRHAQHADIVNVLNVCQVLQRLGPAQIEHPQVVVRAPPPRPRVARRLTRLALRLPRSAPSLFLRLSLETLLLGIEYHVAPPQCSLGIP